MATKVAVVGLGYVGLPLAAEFARRLPTVAFDVQSTRVAELRRGVDRNHEVPAQQLVHPNLTFADDPASLAECDFIIVAVPTPVDRAKRPDLSYLLGASETVGRNLSRGTIVVYESTVYPGCTEEVCVPVLEAASGLKAGLDFSVGYSPERINPGDPDHTLSNIVKIVSAQDPRSLEKVAATYRLIVDAGVHRASDIRTAEAAKVIENIQRDVNIALINELATLFHRMGLNTREILEAAGTKWNFLKFRPGLVGGHCIPVDPYYLAYRAEELGYHAELILAGRRINDEMGTYVAQQTVKQLIHAGKAVRGSRVLVLGVTFKEDVNDVRNSKVFDVIEELRSYRMNVFFHDPMVPELQCPNASSIADPFSGGQSYDAVVLAVPHRAFLDRSTEEFVQLLDRNGLHGVIVDLKGVLRWNPQEWPNVLYWNL